VIVTCGFSEMHELELEQGPVVRAVQLAPLSRRHLRPPTAVRKTQAQLMGEYRFLALKEEEGSAPC